VPLLAVCQFDQRIIQYFDQNWNPTNDTATAKFYRTLEGSPGNYTVRDFFKGSNALQMEAACSSYGPTLVFNGKALFYYDNGNIKREESYIKNERIGTQMTFYENGKPHRQEIISRKGLKIAQHWSSDNEPFLVNGSGMIKGYDNYNGYERGELIKDSLIVLAYKILDNDTIYSVVQQPADYPGGMKTFYNKVAKTMHYPAVARRKGIEGRVFMNFLVLKDGTVQDVTLVRGIGGGCDEEAMQTVKTLGKWVPAKQDGKTVNSIFNLVIIFRLK
jgi:TonB family protein